MKKVLSVIFLMLILINFNCIKTVTAQEETTTKQLKVLGIGNSFTVDATTFLREIALEGGVDLIVGTLQIGGCSLETHWINAQSDSAAYSYTKDDGAAYSTYFPKKDIKSVILSESWDFIVLQQVSYLSGIYSSYQPFLNNLVAYIRELKPQAEILLQQTWAYETDSDHSEFYRYNKNQLTMYNALIDAYGKASNEIHARIIPSGNAVQNARSFSVFDYSNGGKSLNKDGYHMSNIIGRVLVASTWYETLTGKSILDNPFTTFGISEEEHSAIKQAVHNAVTAYTKFKIEKIDLLFKPDKLNYNTNDTALADGGVITVRYSDGEEYNIEVTESMLEYDFSKAGETNVKINYSGKSTEYVVTVIDDNKGCNSTNSIIFTVFAAVAVSLILKKRRNYKV